MGIDIIAQIIATKTVLIAFIVVVCIASIEAGFILGLISKAGSLKNLLKLSFKSNEPANNPNKKGYPATNDINKQKR